MSRKKKELPEIKNVLIQDVAAEGKAIAKIKIKETDESPIVVFIPYGAPGDIVDIKVEKKKKNYAEARIINFVSPSKLRIKPKCSCFGMCGGCKWQHIPYEFQMNFKRRQVIDSLQRIAKVDFPEVNLTLGSAYEWFYRNKMEYTFSNKKWRTWEEVRSGKEFEDSPNALGFHIPGSFDKVLQIDKCYLQSHVADDIRNFIYNLAIKEDLSFFDIKENFGLLRTLMIRITGNGQIMVCIVFGEEDREKIEFILNSLEKKFPEITSIVYVINKKLNDSIADQEVIIYHGKGYLEEEMEGLKFRINTKSFYQTNSAQAYELYKVARRFAGLEKEYPEMDKPIVYDLYTGAGTIANFVSRKAKKVVGIEYVKEAIEDAKINSSINGIDNTVFYAGDMKDILTEKFVEENGKPEIMIIDPPRAGMHEDVIKVIMKVLPKVIVYVSCNPATQARDIALLSKNYKITDVQPVDMFPQTHHVENVVRMELK